MYAGGNSGSVTSCVINSAYRESVSGNSANRWFYLRFGRGPLLAVLSDNASDVGGAPPGSPYCEAERVSNSGIPSSTPRNTRSPLTRVTIGCPRRRRTCHRA